MPEQSTIIHLIRNINSSGILQLRHTEQYINTIHTSELLQNIQKGLFN